MLRRPRRNRKMPAIRLLTQEHHLLPSDFVHPIFLIDGEKRREPILKMPGVDRLTLDLLLEECQELHQKGITSIALFPVIHKSLKDDIGSEAYKEEGLMPKAIRKIKQELPSLCVIADIALDPFTSHGHDGIIKGERIDNDLTVDALCKQALNYAQAGVDMVAPSDMMDGRVKAIRKSLDLQGFNDINILSYTAKYASSLYFPFRDAIQTKLQFGDKKTYQMNPANVREALLEAFLDHEEGADMLMVKPASLYLDVISQIKQKLHLPIAAYHVSGEYAMVMAAEEKGFLNAEQTFYETLISIKRAGADIIFTYALKHILHKLHPHI